MIDEKLYRETFSRLRASDEAKQEVFMRIAHMNETNVRRSLKALRGVAIAAMLTVALAVSANAASNGELLDNLFQTFVITFTAEDGDKTVTVNVTDGVPDSSIKGLFSAAHGSVVTEERDGRLFLIAGGVETDITDALNEEGQYSTALEDGTEIAVKGTVENHMILSTAQDSDLYYITTTGDPSALDGANVDLSGETDVTVSYEPASAADIQAD